MPPPRSAPTSRLPSGSEHPGSWGEGIRDELDELIRRTVVTEIDNLVPADAAAPIAKIDWSRLLLAGSILARSDQRLHQEAALRIATGAVTLSTSEAVKDAGKRPSIFNSFKLPPPTEPNRVLVHNWTFASLAFAKAIGKPDAIEAALEHAAQNPALAPYMAMAQAVRIGHGGGQPFDIVAIANEPRDAFYAALGQRLILLKGLEREEQSSARWPLHLRHPGSTAW